MADVFISYKRENRDSAEALEALLKARGFSVWWDTDLLAGEQFNTAIERELKNAKCVLVLWTRESHQSQYVQAEAIEGFNRNVLVAARLDDVALNYPFAIIQTADLRHWGGASDHRGVRQVLDGVSAKVTGAPSAAAAQTESSAAETPRRPNRGPVIALAAIVVAALVVAGVVFGARTFSSTAPQAAAPSSAPASASPPGSALPPELAQRFGSPETYLNAVTALPGVVTTPSGLRYKIIRPGDERAPPPGKYDEVAVMYEGALVTGTVFDSSYARGRPDHFPLEQIVPGLSEALRLMHPGGAAQVFIPPALGYGAGGAGAAIPPNQILVFRIEMLGYQKPNGDVVGKF